MTSLNERVIDWNRDRNGLKYDPHLEAKMLSSEANEFYMATDPAHALAEYADFLFVSIGTIAKYNAHEYDSLSMLIVGWKDHKELLDWMSEVESDMDDRLETILGLSSHGYQIAKREALEIVTDCNERKPKTKDKSGKVIKGENHMDPVARIREEVLGG